MAETYGIALYNAKGNKYFDTNFTTWNFIGYFVAPANGSVTKTFPNMKLMSEINIQRSFLQRPLNNTESYVHNVGYSKATGTVTASGGKVQTAVFILGR